MCVSVFECDGRVSWFMGEQMCVCACARAKRVLMCHRKQVGEVSPVVVVVVVTVVLLPLRVVAPIITRFASEPVVILSIHSAIVFGWQPCKYTDISKQKIKQSVWRATVCTVRYLVATESVRDTLPY